MQKKETKQSSVLLLLFSASVLILAILIVFSKNITNLLHNFTMKNEKKNIFAYLTLQQIFHPLVSFVFYGPVWTTKARKYHVSLVKTLFKLRLAPPVPQLLRFCPSICVSFFWTISNWHEISKSKFFSCVKDEF